MPLVPVMWPAAPSEDLLNYQGAQITAKPVQNANGTGANEFRIYNPGIPLNVVLTGDYVHVTGNQLWTSYDGTIQDSGSDANGAYVDVEFDSSINTQLQGQYVYQPMVNDYFYICEQPAAGTPLTLTQPGQFSYWLTGTTGNLSIYQTSNPNSDDVLVNDTAFSGNGIGGANTKVNNINLFGTSWDVWGNDVTIDDMQASYVGQFQDDTWVDGFNQDGGNEDGILLAGTGDVVENSMIQYCAGDGVYLDNTGDSVIDCQIHDVDWVGCDYAGVCSNYGGNTITGNTIYKCGRAGINFRVDAGPGADTIDSNLVYDYMLLTTDGAGIYTFANQYGGTIAWNTIYEDNPENGGYGTAAIMLDTSSGYPNSKDFAIYGNQSSGSSYGIKINGSATDCQVYSNGFDASQSDTYTIGGTWGSGSNFYSNILFDPNGAASPGFVGSLPSGSNFVNAPVVTALSQSGTSVTLSWGEVYYPSPPAPPSTLVTEYMVYRQEAANPQDPGGQPPAQVYMGAGNSEPNNTLTWTDDSATDPTNPPMANTTYIYWVVATNNNPYNANVFASNPVTVSFDPDTLWPNTTTPAVTNWYYGGTVELGVKFSSSVPGEISGIQFYESPEDAPNSQVGHLWTASGTLLATVDFTGETASGWQQAIFSTAVPISANTQYIVSYSDVTGYLAGNTNYFSSGYSNGPLTAPVTAGVYGTSAGSFPSNTYEASNYWVQPVFVPGLGPSASLVRLDPSTQGTWTGLYGAQGYNVVDGGSSVPNYASMSITGSQPAYDWSGVTGPQDLQVSPGSSTTVAACDYSSSSFTVNVNISDLIGHQVALYLLDGDDKGRTETVQAFNALTGAVLTPATTVSNFSGGVYLVYNMSGDVNFVITNGSGSTNCVLSGVFFDPA